MKIDTKAWREESLEQVAAHIGYRPWRDLCKLKDEVFAAESIVAAFEQEADEAHGQAPSDWVQDVKRIQEAVVDELKKQVVAERSRAETAEAELTEMRKEVAIAANLGRLSEWVGGLLRRPDGNDVAEHNEQMQRKAVLEFLDDMQAGKGDAVSSLDQAVHVLCLWALDQRGVR